jgi:sialic acid synthase SpsE
MRIGGRRVGAEAPCLIVAEVGVNHNGDVERALRMIRLAAEAGADAVKFQAFAYQARNLGAAPTQLEMLRALELPEEAHARCKALCDELGVLYLCTPFERASADFLDGIGVAAFKVSSGDLDNHPLLRHVAAKGKPMILSTGMAELDEVAAAVRAVRDAGDVSLALLQCTTEYPADPAKANLRAMATLRAAFDAPAGFSDHTPGREAALAAVALGACIVEKHFTLDRALPGPDHKASIEPEELRGLVRAIRCVESALGDGVKRPTPEELATARLVRKGLVAARDIPAGAVMTGDMLTTMRPALGLAPSALPTVVGRVAARAISRFEPIRPEHLL